MRLTQIIFYNSATELLNLIDEHQNMRFVAVAYRQFPLAE